MPVLVDQVLLETQLLSERFESLQLLLFAVFDAGQTTDLEQFFRRDLRGP